MAITLVMKDYLTNVCEYTCLTTDLFSSYPTNCAKNSVMYVMNDVTKKVSKDMIFDGVKWNYRTTDDDVLYYSQRLQVFKVATNYEIDIEDKLFRKVYIKTSNTDAVTITTKNVSRECEFELLLDYATAEVITWFSGITWLGGSAPTLVATHKYIIRFVTIDGGATWMAKSENY